MHKFFYICKIIFFFGAVVMCTMLYMPILTNMGSILFNLPSWLITSLEISLIPIATFLLIVSAFIKSQITKRWVTWGLVVLYVWLIGVSVIFGINYQPKDNQDLSKSFSPTQFTDLGTPSVNSPKITQPISTNAPVLNTPISSAISQCNKSPALNKTLNAVASNTQNVKAISLIGPKITDTITLKAPYSIAVDQQNYKYVTDELNSRIIKFDNDNNYLCSWGNLGSKDGEFIQPYGITVDKQGNVFVSDTYYDNLKGRIEKFDSYGNFKKSWDSSELLTKTGLGFNQPRGITTDSNGNVFVVDTQNNRVIKFDTNGRLITTWGKKGSADSDFDLPFGIAIDKQDNIYVADKMNDRIQVLDNNGKFIYMWGSSNDFDQPEGIAVEDSGNIIVSSKHIVQIFTNKGVLITKCLPGTQGPNIGQFNFPAGVAIDKTGLILVADVNNNRIDVLERY